MNQHNSKSVLITGCSSGIGRCLAEGLKARGYQVFASARKATDVQALAQQGFEALQLDLADSGSIMEATDRVLDRTGGKLYALLNNGAYGQPGAVEDLNRVVLQAQFETNLFGWHELTCRLLPAMRRQGAGRIVQISSVLGLVALPYRGAYTASKFALEGLSDTLRLELAGSGIQVSLIEPGPIDSRFRANAYQAFHDAHINAEHSPHRNNYRTLAARFQAEGPVAPFTLQPEAVLKRVIHALESPRPKARYYVTLPTHLFGLLRRILGTRQLDRILLLVSGGGSR
jgi:NAD(P)-dependent dehydrogenase (short-subunit alcohol dehydrogenase family)